MSEVIITTNTRILDSIDFALELIEREDKSKMGMRVYPDEYSKAINDLNKLKHDIKLEEKNG